MAEALWGARGRPGGGAPLARLLTDYLRALGLPRAGVCLRKVSERESRSLNARFRGVDAATDILSFPALPGRPPRGFQGYLGDLAFCPAYAWKRRGRIDPDHAVEAAFLLLHGLLHLSGRHHDTPAQEKAHWTLCKRLNPLCRKHPGALALLRHRV